MGVVKINFLFWMRSCWRDCVRRCSRYGPSPVGHPNSTIPDWYSFDLHVTRWNTFGIGGASSEVLIKAQRMKVYHAMCKVYRAVRKSRVKAWFTICRVAMRRGATGCARAASRRANVAVVSTQFWNALRYT